MMEECRAAGAELHSEELDGLSAEDGQDVSGMAAERGEDAENPVLGTTRTIARLGAWVHRARVAAFAKMQKDEFELSQVRLITEDQLPTPDGRVYPRPNLLKYKWVLRTCFEHDWKLLRGSSDIGARM